MSDGPMVAPAAQAGPDASAGPTPERILELNDVHTYYGNIHALKGVSMQVGRGEIVTLIGSNGAGKSTTLKTISGVERARQGWIKLEGSDITRTPAHEVVGMGIAHAPEG